MTEKTKVSLIDLLKRELEKAGISLVEMKPGDKPDYTATNTVLVPAKHRAFDDADQWKEIEITARTLDFYNNDTWNLYVILSEQYDRNDVTNEDLFDRINLALSKARIEGPGFRLEFHGFKLREPWGQGHMEMRHRIITEGWDPEKVEIKKFAVPEKKGAKK